ncbi:DNA gyrase inhibitor YacG [Vineibacter terrae]|uniref:DNA gyrase inhibitor YacG n=1 Tax=Vineibacter terrae TaxID=2586908 RepID=A0A5C8PR49_9HYPH|nr:DNA gyrase inhibitor YacG [Vineibacter terrae]TXL77676.1 DNA gyrase inhibitor YacG [Vineibacter terrae]
MSDRPSLRIVRRQAKCPICGKPVEAAHRPFCSKRCADIDLGRWLNESYRVPAHERPADDGDDED